MVDRKLFIVFEGIDGSGKTTQAELLKNSLITRNQQAVISPQPSNGTIGNLIRQALKQRIVTDSSRCGGDLRTRVLFSKDRDLFDRQMAYLFAADRHDHLYNDIDGVFKLIANNYHVISTRYYFSSLAYNSNTVEQFEFVQKLNDHFPNPDLTIYLDIPVEVSLARLKNRSVREIYETKSKLTKVREAYQQIFSDYKGDAIVIDGTQDYYQVHKKIVELVTSY